MRIGAVDVGTNSIHLLIADVQPDGHWQFVHKERRQVELGAGGMDRHELSEGAWERGMDAMAAFAEVARSFDVQHIHCAATSAVREAKNGAAWCRAVRESTGIRVRVISGTEEGRLIYIGARGDLDFSRGKVLIVDLGGGSTEFILCDSDRAHHIQSLPLGHIRLTEHFHRSDPMTRTDWVALKAHVKKNVRALTEHIVPRDVHAAIGTSGTVRCLARMATLARGDIAPEHNLGLVLARPELDTIVRTLQTSSLEKISQMPGVDPKRVRTLTAGAVLVREVLKTFDLATITTSERSLRDGLVMDWIIKHRPEIDLLETTPNPRERSIQALQKRYALDPEHGDYVCERSLGLFDALAPLHRLGFAERELLGFAAQVHDIGHHISGASHNKHGQYLIRHARLHGFTTPEVDMLSALVRYHRGARPKPGHAEYDAMDPTSQSTLKVLAGLLRIADALDRSHDRPIGKLDVQHGNGVIELTAEATAPAHMERWAIEDRKALLEHALQQTVHFKFRPSRHAD